MASTLLDEFANDPREVHALIHGFYAGIYQLGHEPKYPDARAEPHYWRAGYLLGDTVRELR